LPAPAKGRPPWVYVAAFAAADPGPPRAPPGLRARCRGGAGAGRQRHPDRPAPPVARAQRGDLPLADRRSRPPRLLLLRRPDHHRPALLRVPLARRLSAGPYAPRPPTLQELIH